MKTFFLTLFVLVCGIVPNLSLALSFTSFSGPGGFTCIILETLNIIIPILFGIALLLFFWGIAQFILNEASSADHAAGRKFMIYGIIALFCLVSVKGILQFLSNQFEFGQVNTSSGFFLPTGGIPSRTCGDRFQVDTTIIYN